VAGPAQRSFRNLTLRHRQRIYSGRWQVRQKVVPVVTLHPRQSNFSWRWQVPQKVVPGVTLCPRQSSFSGRWQVLQNIVPGLTLRPRQSSFSGRWSRVVSTRRHGNPPSLPPLVLAPLPCVLTPSRCGVAKVLSMFAEQLQLGGGRARKAERTGRFREVGGAELSPPDVAVNPPSLHSPRARPCRACLPLLDVV